MLTTKNLVGMFASEQHDDGPPAPVEEPSSQEPPAKNRFIGGPCPTCGVPMHGINFTFQMFCANEQCPEFNAHYFRDRCSYCTALNAHCCC